MQHETSEPQTRPRFGCLAGDLAAATISASVVAPAVTIIDRAIVEKSSFNQPLFRGLHAHAMVALKRPAPFVFHRPFGIAWTLYAATYSVANGADTVGRALQPSAVGTIGFLSTTLVNVPLAVWKDLSFAQAYGIKPSTTSKNQISAMQAASVRNPAVLRAATAIFVVRDGVTIFGSFTLAPRLSAAHPQAKPVITQLTVLVLTQLVATPIHLLGLDLYTRQKRVPFSDRLVQSQRYLPSSIVLRCVRIIPAFGVGCLLNLELRSFFHARL
ncbi:hypothetical protein NUU61_007447 [Penicillium alfredii]|uniref:Uncharacterized protein n=1 Tax=Penicillium alfredii TaxID=1506179 RepID=A0A9W9F2T3_9EURO|nr:uncharacterized protein NUU61_007447 [Penicillium alfredii]KAJ5092577.1 hypothetical protein NUU61_007447 [Penicillium alfredii]